MKTTILVTSALIHANYERRKEDYVKSLSLLKEWGYTPLIVECFETAGPTFLEEYGTVYYPGVNDVNLRNKGVNEGKALLKALNTLGLRGMLVKLTGRYIFTNSRFLETVERSEYDAVCKLDSVGQVFTGCFAMQSEYLRKFLANLDYETMEKHSVNLEAEVARFLSTRSLKCLFVRKIGLIAYICGQGEYQYTEW